MNLAQPQDATHRHQLYQLLIEIADDHFLAKNLIFKGGTCAALLKKLDRFSVDLDFDLLPDANQKKIDLHFRKIFTQLNLIIKDQNKKNLQYYLSYTASKKYRLTRQTLKVDVVNTVYINDNSAPQFLADIDRYLICQNIETMFSHKLVALIDRYTNHKTIAARDLYDIHHFFLAGYSYNSAIIEERTGLSPKEYLKQVLDFIQKNITQTIIDQDLNILLDVKKFKLLRKIIKIETVNLIQDEIKRQT